VSDQVYLKWFREFEGPPCDGSPLCQIEPTSEQRNPRRGTRRGERILLEAPAIKEHKERAAARKPKVLARASLRTRSGKMKQRECATGAKGSETRSVDDGTPRGQ
jgi:hypothetical protein